MSEDRKNLKNFKEFITLDEGVNDPGIFKAVFLAGGPGSGKSFVTSKTLPNAAFGMKVVNSDQALEFLLKRTGISSNMLTMSPEELERFAATRARAKEIIAKKKELFIKGRLGMILDGTGRDYEKIKGERQNLVNIGYDTFMVFVNTSLDVALERNRQRARKVDEKIVTKAWNDVQNNIGKFQNLFGSRNFIIVDNNSASEDILNKTFKEAKKFVSRPVQSKLAKDWIAQEKKKK